jgi:hypothetical protein
MPPGRDRLSSAQFIPNPRVQYDLNEPWEVENEDGCDIYIDEVRHLPDTCSIVKVITRVVDEYNQDIVKPQERWARL